MLIDSSNAPCSARPQGFCKESIERIRLCGRARFMVEMKSDGAVSHVVTFDADVEQPRSEFAILGTPPREALVIPVHLQYVIAPERLVATLDATEGRLDAGRRHAEQPVADGVWARL